MRRASTLFDNCTAPMLMQGTTVENWVQYGLGLPQYQETFLRNAVTVLDFPLFLEHHELLEQELKITSVLHQRQILRSMHTIILGIGSSPLPVQNVRHEIRDDGNMVVAWDPPEEVCLCHALHQSFPVCERSCSQIIAPAEMCSVHNIFCDRLGRTPHKMEAVLSRTATPQPDSTQLHGAALAVAVTGRSSERSQLMPRTSST